MLVWDSELCPNLPAAEPFLRCCCFYHALLVQYPVVWRAGVVVRHAISQFGFLFDCRLDTDIIPALGLSTVGFTLRVTDPGHVFQQDASVAPAAFAGVLF
jgi:hypothetical protein